jgi:organic hydroperoxide reductase OsmC/OhrA
MSDAYRVELRSVQGGPTALASSGAFSLVTDRPVAAGGGGLGFNGGQLLYAAIAGCYSNDLYREAATLGITLRRVAIAVDGDFPSRGEPSTPITVDLELEGDAPEDRLRELVDLVDRIAEIPNSIRGTTPVTLRVVLLAGHDAPGG